MSRTPANSFCGYKTAKPPRFRVSGALLEKTDLCVFRFADASKSPHGRLAGMNQLIDLNHADKDALDGVEGLNGHGHEIVRYREERGGFTSVDQLEEVPGLTGKVTPEIRASLRVGDG
jgi:competence protein ComEA